MQTKSKVLEDVGRLGLGGLGLLKGVKEEIKRGLRTKMSVIDKDNDMVSREEFRVFTKIVQDCKIKIDELETRIIELENEKRQA